mgnify:CR=1 FL=1
MGLRVVDAESERHVEEEAGGQEEEERELPWKVAKGRAFERMLPAVVGRGCSFEQDAQHAADR